MCCGYGGGVLYLIEKFGVDAYGIDVRLSELLKRRGKDGMESYSKQLEELHAKGILINDLVQNVDQYFKEDQFDAISCAYFGGKKYKKVALDKKQSSEEKVARIFKDKGYLFYVDMDHPLRNKHLDEIGGRIFKDKEYLFRLDMDHPLRKKYLDEIKTEEDRLFLGSEERGERIEFPRIDGYCAFCEIIKHIKPGPEEKRKEE